MLIRSESPEFTENLGRRLAEKLKGTEIIMFYGDLGTGKTTFIRGLASGLGVEDTRVVTSPTYTIMNIYDGKYTIYHYDMYRICSEDDLYSVGFFDYIGKGVVLIEWSENIDDFFPGKEAVMRVRIDFMDKNNRFLYFYGVNI